MDRMTSFVATPTQRAFVGKRNKMTAADVRKHVMTGSLMMLHPGTLDVAFPDGSSTQTLSLVDVVDPVDVEEAFAQRRTSALYDISSTTSSPRKVSEFPADDVEVRIVPRDWATVDPPVPLETKDLKIAPHVRDIICSFTDQFSLVQKRVSEFPADDVEVRIVPRDWATVDPPVPLETKDLKIAPHVRDIICSFTDQFSLVQKRYQQFSSADAYVRMLIERPIIVRSTPRPIFEADAGRAERVARSVSVVGDSVRVAYFFVSCSKHLPRYSLFAAVMVDSKRQSYASTASSGTMGSAEGDSRESRLHQSQPDPTIPGVIQRSSFTQLDLLSDARRQAAIYDAKARRKVTENFYFDVNPEEIRRMVDKNISFAEATDRCSQAAFSLSCPLTDLFIVIKLEKVLQACEIIDASEPYTNCAARDERTREKLAAAAADFCDRLGSFRMPLGFMVLDLQKVLMGVNTLERSEMCMSTMTTGSVGTAAGEAMAPLACIAAETDSIVSADRMSNTSTSTFRRMGSGSSAAAVLSRVRTPLQRRKFLGGGGGSDDATTPDGSSAGKSIELNLANLQPVTLNLNSFFRQEADRLSDEDLYKLLADARRPGGKLSRLKTFAVDMGLQLSGGTGEELLMRLSPEMLRVAPFSGGPGTELTKDIQEFPAKGFYMANTSYRNLMYIYPKSANLTNRPGTARNISIKVELMNAQEQPLRVLYSRGAGSDMVSVARTAVIYHNKTPHITDEIKLRIPVDLDDGHHLLFTFYHISCKSNNKDEETEYPIGYSWLPLLRDSRLSTGDFNLPICLDRLPSSYGYLSPDVALPNVRWLDGHKPVFNVTIKAISTVHPQDEHLERFLVAVNSLSSTDRRKPPASEIALITAAQPTRAFFPDALSSACFETLGQLVKICTMLLDSCLDMHGRSALLTSYVHYYKIAMKEDVEKLSAHHQRVPVDAVPSTSNKAVHEELAEQWVRSGGCAREMAFLNAWFFLELMGCVFASWIVATSWVSFEISTEIFHTGIRSTTTTLDSWGSLGSGELSYEFRRCHYLVGLALADLAAVLDSSNSSVLHARRAKAIGLIHNLLSSHEADSRLTDPTIRARVAGLYLPLVTIVLDVAGQIHDPFANSPTGTSRFSREDRNGNSTSPGVNPKVALAIAGIGSAPSPPRTPTEMNNNRPEKNKAMLNLELSRQSHAENGHDLDETLTECVVTRRDGVRWRIGPPSSGEADSRRTSSLLYEDEALLEAALCTEVMLCVLDTLETIIRVISMPGSDHLHFALPMILRGILHMLSCNQSVQALECIFVSQRTVVKKFPDMIFEQVGFFDPCFLFIQHSQLLRKLSSVENCAYNFSVIVHLDYQPFELSGSSLARVKMQITMSLSTLVSNATREGVWLNEDCLRRSLKSVIKARPEPMVAFMYNVLDKLIALIANKPYSGNLYTLKNNKSKARSQLCKDMAAEKNKPGSPETQKLYHIIGLFPLQDAFSLMDRSYVMGLVRDFNRDISHRISCIGEPAATTLMLLKLDFVRIVSSHEHFVILNLPFGPPHSVPTSTSSSSICISSGTGSSVTQMALSPESGSISSRSTTTTLDSWGSLGSGELSYEFRRCHYLVGLALADLAAVLDSSNSSVLHARRAKFIIL
ncbi:hypothetical protein OSTOST_05532 [Ostertagia ostertagi]